MHVNAKKVAFGGLFLALTEIFMMLGSVIETNTLFLLAAASYFVGIMIRESGKGEGAAFYIAGVLLGFLLTPNKLYVCSYAAMGLYILLIEVLWPWIGRFSEKRRLWVFWLAKFLIFNGMYVLILLGFGRIFITGEITPGLLAILMAAGQIGLIIYDRAYEYVQVQIWGKLRVRFLK